MKQIKFLIIFLFVVTASCTTKHTDNNQDSTLTLGVMASMDYLPIALAQEKGYFSEEGIEVIIHKFYSANERDAALQSNRLDGTILDYTGGAIQASGGVPLQFTSQCEGTFELIVRNDDKFKALSDLKNAKVAVSRNTVIDFCTDLALELANISPEEIEKQEINKIPLRLEMLNNQKIDASMLPDPFATIAKNDNNVSMISMKDLDVYVTGIVFLKKTIEEKNNTLHKFYKAYNRAVNALETLPENEMTLLLTKEIGFPPSLANMATIPVYSKAQPPRTEDLNNVDKWLRKRDLLKDNFDINSIVNKDFTGE